MFRKKPKELFKAEASENVGLNVKLMDATARYIKISGYDGLACNYRHGDQRDQLHSSFLGPR